MATYVGAPIETADKSYVDRSPRWGLENKPPIATLQPTGIRTIADIKQTVRTIMNRPVSTRMALLEKCRRVAYQLRRTGEITVSELTSINRVLLPAIAHETVRDRKTREPSLSDLNLNTRISNALAESNIESVEVLVRAIQEGQVIPGLGSKSIEETRRILVASGYLPTEEHGSDISTN